MSAEDLLTRTFSEVAATTDYPTTPMATVAARAAARRRARRRATALVAAAAVVLAGVSAVAWLNRPHDTGPAPIGPLPALPQGAAPRIDYLDGDTFVASSGARLSSPILGAAETATASGAGVLAAATSAPAHQLTTLSMVSSEASVRRLGCGLPRFAVSATGSSPAYWLADRCRRPAKPPYLVGGRLVVGGVSTDTPKGASYSLVGVLPDGVLSWVTGVTRTHVVVVRPDGSERPVPHVAYPLGTSAAADLVAGNTADLKASVVVDASTGQVLWRQPGWALSHFSTSGRYVAGRQGVTIEDADPTGATVGIWDAATGRQVVSAVLPGLTVTSGLDWEGDGSVLVVVKDRYLQEAILRVGLDGTVTRATRVAPATPGDVPVFRLATTP